MTADPNAIRLQMASRYLQSGNLDQAEKLLLQVLSESPDHVVALREMALVHLQQGHLSLASEGLTKVTNLEPHSAEAHVLLGNLHKNLGDREGANACNAPWR